VVNLDIRDAERTGEVLTESSSRSGCRSLALDRAQATVRLLQVTVRRLQKLGESSNRKIKKLIQVIYVDPVQ